MAGQTISVSLEPTRAARSRYREERTLVRALLPMTGLDRQVFKAQVRRLRDHFEQFNADVAGICQWVFKLRPESSSATPEAGVIWKVFLEPEKFVPPGDESAADRFRLRVFEAAALKELPGGFDGQSLPSDVQQAIVAVAQLPRTQEAKRTFARLSAYSRPHRLVLLKSAAEWIRARYLRGYENWLRQHDAWEKEKSEWEQSHPELTEDLRKVFNDIFRQIGVKEKRARICPWEHLQKNLDNCQFAGEGQKERHSPLCKLFARFIKDKKWKKHFRGYAEEFLRSRKQPDHPKARKWFPRAWREYRRALNLTEDTLRRKHNGRLPHCDKTTGECRFNPHTDKCRQFKEQCAKLPPEVSQLEPLYREWRRFFLAGPRRPNFCYPSARLLSTPKIFGSDFFRADFHQSQVGLRLEDMSEGELLWFRFAPWPQDYNPQPHQAEVSSVHLHFVGTRPRLGFRFCVAHKASRFACTQDELDELRSKKFPRQAQDQQFLDAARQRLLESFSGSAKSDLRVMAVDLGTTGASRAFFVGNVFQDAKSLPVLKLEKLFAERPQPNPPQPQGSARKPRLGLSPEHVTRHMDAMSREASKITGKRGQVKKDGVATLRAHDLRGLIRHVAWMMRDWVRLNASQIIQAAEEKSSDLIVFESLRGFRLPGYDSIKDLDPKRKRQLAFWAFGRIRRKLIEKAVERGMRVVTVPYLNSSQVCCQCGCQQENTGLWRKNKRKRTFACEFCKSSVNSDENAARVLGRVFWGEISLPVHDESPKSPKSRA